MNCKSVNKRRNSEGKVKESLKLKRIKNLKMIFDKKEREEDEENKENGKNKNLYDEIVPESVSIDDVIGMHDMKYMQVHSGTGKKDKVDRRMDASTFVSFLIFAVLRICGKNRHEQSRQIARVSQMSQPSLFSQRCCCPSPHRAPARPNPGCAAR